MSISGLGACATVTLGAKDHEADRWVAAVAIASRLPLATEDTIFDGVPALLRAEPNGSANS